MRAFSLDSATWSVTHGASYCNRRSYAPTHLVWVERMLMHYSSAQNDCSRVAYFVNGARFSKKTVHYGLQFAYNFRQLLGADYESS